jgi:hypothetical protein
LTNEQLGKRYPLRADMNSSLQEMSHQQIARLISLITLPSTIQEMIENGYSSEKGYTLSMLAFDIRWNQELNDFNYAAEPEDWKDKRVNYQLSLAEKSWTVEDLRKRVKNLIGEEERRRKALELAKMKTQQRIEQMEKDATTKMNKLAKIIEELDEYFAIKWTAKKGKKALRLTNEQLGKRYSLRASGNGDALKQLSSAHITKLINLVTLPESIQKQIENGYPYEKGYVLSTLAFDIRWNQELNDFNYAAFIDR